MKIIFLDVDGVLNSEDSILAEKDNVENWMDAEVSDRHISYLKKVVDETGAQIVLSSSWRTDHPKFTGEKEITDPMFKVLDRKLRKVGLEIIDVTPFFMHEVRGTEIQDWLDRHSEVENYVILDDDPDMLENQMNNFVNTTFKSGLTEELANKAISILNR